MTTYVLCIYKIFKINDSTNEESVNHVYVFHNVHVLENTTNACISSLLKTYTSCIKTLLLEKAPCMVKIIEESNIGQHECWNKWHITESCRYVCNSMCHAKRILYDQYMQMKTSQSPLGLNKYSCEICKYSCNAECQWIRHQSGKKHLDKLATQSNDDKKSHICSLCNKIYLSRTSLWKHSKVCSGSTLHNTHIYKYVDIEKDIICDAPIRDAHVAICDDGPVGDSLEKHRNQIITLNDDMLLEMIINQNKTLIAQNTEFKEIIIEQNAKMLEYSKKPTTISNNNHFNLNVFLNETCKDAMTLTEFVNSLQISSYNVEYTGIHGYVAGISKIFMDGLRQLEVNMRPIHCTDLKREILYIKEADAWEKDNPEKSKFKKALNTVVRKNMQQMREWMNQNPRCEILDTNEYHLHLKIMKQCIGGDVHQEDANNRKILRNIAKEVVIDRSLVLGQNGQSPIIQIQE